YLHGNCGHCHERATGAAEGVPVELSLQQPPTPQPAGTAVEVLLAAEARQGGAHAGLVVPGRPEQSLLLARMQSRNPYVQMPPLGTRLADADGTALVARWIAELDRGAGSHHRPGTHRGAAMMLSRRILLSPLPAALA